MNISKYDVVNFNRELWVWLIKMLFDRENSLAIKSRGGKTQDLTDYIKRNPLPELMPSSLSEITCKCHTGGLCIKCHAERLISYEH